MDDEDDIYTEANDNPRFIYSMPSLTQKNVYPIRIYRQLSKLKERKPFCGTRAQYQRLLARIKIGNQIPLFGRFCIYTAVNQEKKLDNYWECWRQIENAQKAIAMLRINNPLQPGTPLFRYDQWFIPENKKKFCDHMMTQMAEFFCDKNSELQEGPYVTTIWGRLLKNGKRQEKETKHELIVFKSIDFDLKDVLTYWSHEETSHILYEAIASQDCPIIIPLTTCLYGEYDTACDEKQEEREKNMYDVEAMLVQQEYKKSSESKVYKLS